jgi:Putative addiction module component
MPRQVTKNAHVSSSFGVVIFVLSTEGHIETSVKLSADDTRKWPQKAVLHLPKQERAQLARLLLESLDQSSDADIRQLWVGEAERRAAEIDRGEVQLVTERELELQVQALFR